MKRALAISALLLLAPTRVSLAEGTAPGSSPSPSAQPTMKDLMSAFGVGAGGAGAAPAGLEAAKPILNQLQGLGVSAPPSSSPSPSSAATPPTSVGVTPQESLLQGVNPLNATAAQTLPGTAAAPATPKTSVEDLLANDEPESAPQEDEVSPETLLERRRYSLKVKGASLRRLLQMISEKARLTLNMEAGLTGTVSLSTRDKTLLETLDELSERQGFEYEVENGVLAVFRPASLGGRGGAGRGTASLSSGEGADTGTSIGSTAGRVALPSDFSLRQVPVRFSVATKLLDKLNPLLLDGEKIIPDEATNTLLFQGTPDTYNRLLEVIQMFDQVPQQILIESQIVETSRSFIESLGLAWGNMTASSTSTSGTSTASFPGAAVGPITAGAAVNAPGPASANGAMRLQVGSFLGSALDLQIAAAESRGDAKVVSRPKIVTLNNNAATITSGLSFYVKTLTSTSISGASSLTTGGVTSLSAGLTLNVTPTIMGKEMVRMQVQINNSQPDEGSAVDGIPGVINNSANTTIIVNQSRTAVIAGLIKNSQSHSESGVPFLSRIPVLGWLFRNSSDADRNNELVIFITPYIVSPDLDLRPPATMLSPAAERTIQNGSGSTNSGAGNAGLSGPGQGGAQPSASRPSGNEDGRS